MTDGKNTKNENKSKIKKKKTKGKGKKEINTCTDRVHACKQDQRQRSTDVPSHKHRGVSYSC